MNSDRKCVVSIAKADTYFNEAIRFYVNGIYINKDDGFIFAAYWFEPVFDCENGVFNRLGIYVCCHLLRVIKHQPYIGLMQILPMYHLQRMHIFLGRGVLMARSGSYDWTAG